MHPDNENHEPWTDPVLKELREIKQQLFAECGSDHETYARFLEQVMQEAEVAGFKTWRGHMAKVSTSAVARDE